MKLSRLLALAALLGLTGCAALPGLAAAFGMAAPVVTAIDQQLQRAQALAPNLSPDRADDVALLAELVARLDAVDRCQANATAAISTDAGTTTAEKTTAALIDAAASLRGLVDAIAKAQPAPLSPVVPSTLDAGAPVKGSP